jgi:hypothetical protein
MAQVCNPTHLVVLLMLFDFYLILCRMFTQLQILYTNIVRNEVHAPHPHGVCNCCLQIVFLTHCVGRSMVYLSAIFYIISSSGLSCRHQT